MTKSHFSQHKKNPARLLSGRAGPHKNKNERGNKMKQQTPEWFAARRGRIPASVIGAIMGTAPYMTRDDVIRQMVREHFGAESEFEGNIATEYGNRNEEGARLEYEMETESTVTECGFYTGEPDIGASPDGLLAHDGLLEIKCPFGKRKITDAAEFKPLADQPHYYAQIQMQLYVTGREWCHFFQWAMGATKLEHVEYDAEFVEAEMLPAIAHFRIDLAQAIAKPDEHLEPLRKEINTTLAEKLIAEYDELRDAEDRAKERAKEVLAELVEISGGKNALIHGRKLTNVQRAGSVGYARIVKAELPDIDLDQWRGKPSSSWRLT